MAAKSRETSFDVHGVSGNNTDDGLTVLVTINHDKSDMYFMALPRPLRDFLKYEALMDFAEIESYKDYREYGAERLLDFLRYQKVQSIRELHGDGHPQVEDYDRKNHG